MDTSVTMRRLGLLVLFLEFLTFGAPAQDVPARAWARIDASRLLYLTCPVRAEARLDGVLRGTTPLLLELEPGEHGLEVSIRDAVFRRTLIVQSDSGGLDRLEAVLEPYVGSLRIACDEPDALLSVDGSSPVPITPLPLTIREGEHRVRVAAPGRIAFSSFILVPRDRLVKLRVDLERGFPLRFAAPPPVGSTLAVLDTFGQPLRTIDLPSVELLGAGTGRFRLNLPSGYSTDFSWDPQAADAAEPSCSGRLLLENLPAGSRLELDGLPAEAGDRFAVFTLAPGFHRLKIQKRGFMTVVLFCEIHPGRDTRPRLAFIEDKALAQAGRNAIGLPIMVSGGVLALGGFVLNQDTSAMALSSDYEGYKILKYIGLGALGAGLAALASGIGVVTIHL